MTSPIVLFVFARPEHTHRTLAALAANMLAEKSDLIVYADAERKDCEVVQVRAVRALIHAIKGFRSVTIIERECNYGLARNIIEGVTEVCNRHGRVIVLEDDIVTSPYFLSYMNMALDKYVDEKNIWHISGWNYPIDPDGLGEAFFWRVMNCWGWATWADRWKHYTKEPNHLTSTWNKEKITQFNLDGGHNFWSQVTANQNGSLNTWAIFWYATIFEHEGLCLNPSQSLVCNIGNDASGENCCKNNFYSVEIQSEKTPELPSVCGESSLAVKRVKLFYKNISGVFRRKIGKWFRKLTFG